MENFLSVISIVWLTSFIALTVLYWIDKVYWEKSDNLDQNKRGNLNLIMFIPAFVGAPLFLMLFLFELYQKGGFGREK